MKILFITDSFPLPLDSGGKIVTFQKLQVLGQKHSVHLVCFYDKKPTAEELKKMKSIGVTVSSFRYPAYQSETTQEKISALLKLWPLDYLRFYKTAFSQEIKKLLATDSFDTLYVDHLYMAQYLPEKKREIWIFCEHNIEHKLHYDFFRFFKSSKKEKLANLYNAFTIWKYERYIVKKFDRVSVLSHKDKKSLIQLGVQAKKIIVVPPCQKLERPFKKQNSHNLLFVGSMWWPPNVDAIRWFIREVFPQLQIAIPDITLTVIGEDPTPFKKEISQNSALHFPGKIADLNPYFDNSSVFILPFRIGEGIRIKALTAFSQSLPVVSTAKGVQGLSVRKGVDYLEVNTAEAFVQSVKRLLHDPTLQKKLAKNAQEYLRNSHNLQKLDIEAEIDDIPISPSEV